MKQISLYEGWVRRQKRTRKVEFLEEMESVVPWAALEALIELH